MRSGIRRREAFKDAHPFRLKIARSSARTRDLESLPTSNVKARLWIRVGSRRRSARGKLVRIAAVLVAAPRPPQVDVFHGGSDGFDLDRLNLDVRELERVGPLVLVDHNLPRGERVLVWTQ